MKRETKLGLVVACSFLFLVGVVLYSKYKDGFPGLTAAASSNTEETLPAGWTPAKGGVKPASIAGPGATPDVAPQQGPIQDTQVVQAAAQEPAPTPAPAAEVPPPPTVTPTDPALSPVPTAVPATTSPGTTAAAPKPVDPPAVPAPSDPVTEEKEGQRLELVPGAVAPPPAPARPSGGTTAKEKSDSAADKNQGGDGVIILPSPPPPSPPAPEVTGVQVLGADKGESKPQGKVTGVSTQPVQDKGDGAGGRKGPPTGNPKEQPANPPKVALLPPGPGVAPAPPTPRPPQGDDVSPTPVVDVPPPTPSPAAPTPGTVPDLVPLPPLPGSPPAPAAAPLPVTPAPAATPPPALATPGLPGGAPPAPLPPLGTTPVGTTPPIAVPGAGTPAPAKPRAAVSAPVVDSFDEEVYRCRQGDTWDALSKHFYNGSEKYGRALFLFNNKHPMTTEPLQDSALAGGQTVYVPPISILEKRYASAIPGYTPLPPARAEVNSSPAVAGKPGGNWAVPQTTRRYRVKAAAETMYDIAQRTLRNKERWSEIYNLNRGKNYDPMKVPANAVLDLPADAVVDADHQP